MRNKAESLFDKKKKDVSTTVEQKTKQGEELLSEQAKKTSDFVSETKQDIQNSIVNTGNLKAFNPPPQR